MFLVRLCIILGVISVIFSKNIVFRLTLPVILSLGQNKFNIIPHKHIFIRAFFISLVLLILLIPSELLAQENPAEKTLTNSKRLLDEPVEHDAVDSTVLDIVEQKVYLYSGALVKFGEIQLKAGYIEYDFKNKNVCAYPRKDSSGKEIEFPEFTDGNETFTAKLMCYNFETKKAFVEGSRAKQGEGFVHFDKVKVYENKETHGLHGKYTTCDAEHPHYYFNISKAVVKPNDKIVAGPLMLYIADVPTPLALPFGFFPNQKNKGAGIIIPTYDNSIPWGSGLRNGGYYIPIKDKADIQLTGSIYARGTWGVRAVTRYKSLYKHNGNFQLSFQENINGDKELPILTRYSKSRIFSVIWNHNQDPKARPNSTFNANVNYNSNARTDINSQGTGFLNNSYQSSISYRKIFPNTPFSVNVNASQSGTYIPADTSIRRQAYNNLTFNLPDINFAMNRIYPFKSLENDKNAGKKWMKEASKIFLTWNAQMRNEVNFIDTALGGDIINQLLPKVRNGVQHNISAGTSLKVLKKNVTLNPSLRLTERWYFQQLDNVYDPILDEVVSDTLRGIENWSRAMNGSMSLSATTKLYGFYQFANFAKGKRQTLVRHVFTPSVSYNYTPSLNTFIDTQYINVNNIILPYTPLQLGVYGVPPRTSSGAVGLNLTNSFEMKIKTKTDTGMVYKRVKLIDNLTLSTSYDLIRKEFKLSDINITGRTTLFKTIGLNGNMRFNPYALNDTARSQRINEYEFVKSGKLARMTDANLAANFSLSPETFRNKKENQEVKNEEINPFDIPWNASFSYNLNVRNFVNSITDRDTTTYIQTAGASGSITFTQNWRVGFNLNYDITNKKLSYTSLDIYRDLHCWEMRLSWVPFGPRQSYNFQINVKSSILQDLQYKKQSQPNEFR